MTTVLETPPRPARDRPETELLFAWLEDALGDPIVDTHEFLTAIGRLAELLEHPTFSPTQPDFDALDAHDTAGYLRISLRQL